MDRPRCLWGKFREVHFEIVLGWFWGVNWSRFGTLRAIFLGFLGLAFWVPFGLTFETHLWTMHDAHRNYSQVAGKNATQGGVQNGKLWAAGASCCLRATFEPIVRRLVLQQCCWHDALKSDFCSNMDQRVRKTANFGRKGSRVFAHNVGVIWESFRIVYNQLVQILARLP